MKAQYLIAAMGLLGLVGCAKDGGSDPAPATMSEKSKTQYSVSLSGKEVIPSATISGAAAPAMGSASITHDSMAAMNLTGTLTLSDLATTVTAAHVHRGYAGQDGGVVSALTPAASGSGYQINANLNADDVTALMMGGLYLNVHSGTGGAIQLRGQILPAGMKTYRTSLMPANNVTTGATGVAAVTVKSADRSFVAYITLRNLTNTYTNAHIHIAAGQPAAGFQEVTAQTVYKAEGTFTAAQMDELANGTLYVNVHTQAYPTGEIRGNLMADAM